jgi:hypothetical protein
MDLEQLKSKKFTEVDLEEIRKTRSGTFSNAKSRLNVNLVLVYEKVGDAPAVIESRKATPVANPEDSIKRNVTVKKGESLLLDYSWLKGKMGSIFIKNTTGGDRTTNPTDVTKKQISESEVIVLLGHTEVPLIPNQIMYFPVPRNASVSILAPVHDVNVQYGLFPS